MAYIDVGKIETIRFMCHKILPLVYDESLSYYETLCKVSNKLNETIEATNQLNENVDSFSSAINSLNSRVTQIATEMNTFEANLTARFNELEARLNNEVDTRLDAVDAKMDELDHKVDLAIASIDIAKREMKDYIESEIETLTRLVNNSIADALHILDQRMKDFEFSMQVYIKAQLQAYLDQIPEIENVIVFDPVEGKLAPIQDVIDHLYWDTHVNALDCFEFDHLGLTCEQLDNFMVHSIPRGLSVWEWMNKARLWVWTDPKIKMREYTTGKHVLTRRNVDINNMLLKYSGTYTAKEFDSLNEVVSDFDALEVTAYNFDWHSNTTVVHD